MNTKEAILFLEKQGYKVYDDGTPADEKTYEWAINSNRKRLKEIQDKKIYRVWQSGHSFGVYTGRELVIFAKNCKSQVDKNFKKFNNSTVRRATRDLIKKEKFDDLPQNAPPDEENRWAWD